MALERREEAARRGARGPRIVAIGGGSGLSATLRGLKGELFGARARPADGASITAIVNVVDDGGSSGRLRARRSLPAPGDVRQCLVALSDGDPVVSALFQFRFSGDDEVGGHSLGNLVIAALSQMGGGAFHSAVDLAAKLLHVQGRVLPCTDDDVALAAQFDDGTWVRGESQIPLAHGRIQRVRLCPEAAHALPESCDAVRSADLVVIGPGSIYTSLIPPLLLGELCDGIVGARVPVAFVSNLMTEPGETDGYDVAEMVRAIRSHAPRLHIHYVLVNSAPLAPDAIAGHRAAGAAPVAVDRAALRAMGCEVVEADLAAAGCVARHDPEKLGRSLVALVRGAGAGAGVAEVVACTRSAAGM